MYLELALTSLKQPFRYSLIMAAKDEIIETAPPEVGLTQRQQPSRWFRWFGKDVSYVSIDEGYDTSSETSSLDEHEINNSRNVFQSPEAAGIYKLVDGYEGAHRFQPDATWTPEEEQKLVRTLDWRIALACCLMFFALQLDRGNITQALSDNMLKNLGLTTNDYNNGMSVFYCSFLFAELPSQMIGKKLGPDVWIPIQMVLWSAVAMSQAAISGKTSFYITRWLLGMLEGGELFQSGTS